MRIAPLVLAFAILVISGCKTAPPEPSLLDREFEAYRLDRDERRMDDLKVRSAKAKVEADRLENELAALMRRIREAKAKLPDARAEVESLPVATPAAPAAAPPAATPDSVVKPPTPGPLPAPVHRTQPASAQ